MKIICKLLFGLFVLMLLSTGCATYEASVEAPPVVAEPTPVPIQPAEQPIEVKPVATPNVVPEIVKDSKTMILMKTTQGDIQLELDAEHAPNTVANFLKYVESGHYAGTIFHRVINDFMIQGGGFTAQMVQKDAPYTVDNEANNGLKNDRGTIAMARTSDPHSAGAQFFINVKDNGFLNFTAPTQQGWGYCVFGKVVAGMEVVDTIKAVPTGYQDVPNDVIEIQSITVVD